MVNPVHKQAVIELLEEAHFPSGSPNKSDAWLGIIQVIAWYEFGFLHIIDGSELNPERRRQPPRHDRPWQLRSKAAEQELISLLRAPSADARSLLGLMWKHELWSDCVTPNQKANPAGNALRYLSSYLLQLWGDARLDYREEQQLATYWPGFAIPGVATPAADVLAVEHVGATPVSLVSCKWSMRTDRVSDTIRECGAVKGAAHRLQQPIRFFIVCHEYAASRVEKLLDDKCVDGLALVNLPLMPVVGQMTDRLKEEASAGRLISFEQLIDATYTW